MRLLLLFVLALSLHILKADEKTVKVADVPLIEKYRADIEKIIGEDWTLKLLGPAKIVKEEMPMPKIPKIVEEASSTAVYNQKKESIILKPEVEEKFNYIYIKELYEATRQQKPNQDEIAKMMNVLSQGGSREGVYRSLVLDSTYLGMEEWDKPVKSNTADYAVYFYEKYLGKKVIKKSFEGMSVFTLKRLMTEKCLEILDAYNSSDNRKDLEMWYGILSADLATRFPQVWTNKIRKNNSALDHQKWASQVPLQHVKSELIIKLHSALNSMM